MTAEISRRSTLKFAGVAAGAAGLGIGTVPAATPAAAAGGFAHPGLLHTGADLRRMAAKVKAGAQPYTAGFARLTANRHAQSGWKANPQETVVRGGTGQNYVILYNDIHAAYQNGLRHHITGEAAHADTAVAILNDWSARLTSLAGNADRFLAAGLYGYQIANAAELVRDHPDFALDRFQEMLSEVFAPISDDFLVRHNGAVITNYWPNWDLANMACVLAAGIFCDDKAQVARAVDYFKNGEGLGAVEKAVPVVHDDGLAEWLEAGRDQGHALLGVGLMGTFCEMAWNQGIDLYGYDDNRFLKGAQYVAKWCMGGQVAYTENTRAKGAINGWSGRETASRAAGVDPNMTRPIWAMIANHYTRRRGLDASYVTRIAAKSSPEGGGGDYGPNSGGFDQLGFGTLAFSRDRTTTAPGSKTASPSASAQGGRAGRGEDLAATGTSDFPAWTAAGGVAALAGGLLLLRRRFHSGGGAAD
ncbi:LPXTG cell wall anchor domain-containing protein [Streptomyces phaeolivaceus]|uniref:LPXTG cell wall anchor domain-containing protein n=1 Tax=Streptomyces phaeolivaceus TaxID=2653200 RepID=A0A5P8JZ99_9ACTN|nr:alginate lyase family protein [Streptomyces phaeolivaceus]QFQ95717.1 LPXTG cell wall anchor domain-containing protein [Streptomyces phaeolivaceus]